MVYVSFDVKNDYILKDFITKMSRLYDSPFEVSYFTPEKFISLFICSYIIRSEIIKSNVLLILLGPDTYKSKIVQLEVKIANEENIKIIQMNGYRSISHLTIKGTNISFEWDWDLLKQLMNDLPSK